MDKVVYLGFVNPIFIPNFYKGNPEKEKLNFEFDQVNKLM